MYTDLGDEEDTGGHSYVKKEKKINVKVNFY